MLTVRAATQPYSSFQNLTITADNAEGHSGFTAELKDRLTQLLREISARKSFLGGRGESGKALPGRKADNLTAIYDPIV
jgi:hypothetical protein